jgi:molecular chaperone HtpG
MLKHERTKYIEFFDAYKHALKYGIYDKFGMNKEKLQELILFKTNKSDDYITLSEYIEHKQVDQKAIYYASGKSKETILKLPQMDLMVEKDLEVLLFTDDIDEFMIQMMQSYQDLPFKSVQNADTDLIDETKKDALKDQEKEHKDILKALKKILKDKVKDVKLSYRLKESPVCLVSGEGLSLEMEKVLKSMPNSQEIKAERILEINPDHELFKSIENIYLRDKESVNDYATILYHQALLLEGLPIEDASEFSSALTKLMIETSKK